MKKYQERTLYTMVKSNRMAELSLMGYNLEKDDTLYDIKQLAEEWKNIDVELLSPMTIKKIGNLLDLNLGLPEHAKILSSEEHQLFLDKIKEYEEKYKSKNICVFVDFIEKLRDNHYKYEGTIEDYVIEQNKAMAFESNTATAVIGVEEPEVYYLINSINEEEELDDLINFPEIERTNKITFHKVEGDK